MKQSQLHQTANWIRHHDKATQPQASGKSMSQLIYCQFPRFPEKVPLKGMIQVREESTDQRQEYYGQRSAILSTLYQMAEVCDSRRYVIQMRQGIKCVILNK